MDKWRIICLIVILVLSSIDLILTYCYVRAYKDWQPNKPYKLIELNPLLVFLWNNLGLIFGMISGAVIIMTLNFLIVKNCHWIIIIILIGLLIFAMFNHYNNLTLLNKLILKYPSGSLPLETFGEVIGNNLNKSGG